MGCFGDRSPWPIGSCCGLIFGPWIFWGINEGPRDFFGFWFLPQFNHPRHLESGVPPLPPPPPSGCNVDTIYITIHQVSHSGYSSHADIGHQQQLPVTCPLLMLLILLRRNAWAPHVSRLTLQGEVILLQRAKLVLPILLVNNHWVDLPGKDGSPPDCRLVGLRCYELWTMKYDSVTS